SIPRSAPTARTSMPTAKSPSPARSCARSRTQRPERNDMSALRADARTYCQLRFPRRSPAFALPIVWLTSPGLWRLAVHRFCRWGALRRQAQGRTPVNIALLLLAFGLHRIVIMLTKVDTSNETDIEGGVYLSDRGNIVFGSRHVGAGTIVHHRVT